MNIIEQLQHPHLFGALPEFANLKTWALWLTFLKSLYGLPLNGSEVDAFKQFTGRSTYNPPPGGFPEGVVIAGVQCGKSSIAGALMGSAALTGEPGTVAVGVAQDHRGSMRVLLRYARAPFETLDLFKAEVARDTADLLELQRGTALAAFPCKPSSLRGVKASIVVLDEPAHFVSTDGRPTDLEMWRVARGRVAMTGGKIVAISSPYAQSGLLFELHRRHFGNDESQTLIWQCSSKDLNPLLSESYLERMREDDPLGYESEVMGQFRAGLSALFDPDALDACVDTGVRERLPEKGHTYTSFVDAASGSGADSFAIGIAHADGKQVLLDLVKTWPPKFNPNNVIAECAELLKMYGLYETCGDRYAPGFVTEGFHQHQILYRQSEKDRSAIYLEALPSINAGRFTLLDKPDLLRELRGLERRRGTGGRDKVDHRRGMHDDAANVAMGACVNAVQAESQVPTMWNYLTGEYISPVLSDEEKRLRKEAYLRSMDVEVLRAQYKEVQ
ncbi:MAG: hypothetical protein KF751_06140 [Nitrospira sp.]|nr:hypothetical protein [Nitrospira sp.]